MPRFFLLPIAVAVSSIRAALTLGVGLGLSLGSLSSVRLELVVPFGDLLLGS